MVRSDYEHCIGGIGAALIADHEDTLHINELLRQSRDIFECEKHNEQAIKELKVIRELENEDILRCTAINDFNTRIGEIRMSSHIRNKRKLSTIFQKIACALTPIPWSLQEFAKNILKEPSQCRELYLLQRERCAFILDCCPEYSEKAAKTNRSCFERSINHNFNNIFNSNFDQKTRLAKALFVVCTDKLVNGIDNDCITVALSSSGGLKEITYYALRLNFL
uniref:Uncharacterized protein n=1 Tax=Ascaris lumbricoides TaxID=6252 RepID=A0A0M3IT70_ASCLU